MRYKVANEAISSIKQLKLLRREKVFIQEFEKASKLDAKYNRITSLEKRKSVAACSFCSAVILLQQSIMIAAFFPDASGHG